MEKTTDKEQCNQFDALLAAFDKLITGNPPPEKIKEKLLALKEQAKTSTVTGHQLSAITARCDNYLNGTWAVDATKVAYQKSLKEEKK